MERERTWATSGIDAAARAALARELPPSATWSLLLEILGERAQQRTASDLVQQFERDGFTRPAPIDQRTLAALDTHLLAAAEAFEAIELSPLAPLGACSVVGPTSQNKIVSALRGTEVVSDPTNVLALECALRLRRNAAEIVRLATCQRCVRAQEVPKKSGYSPHFRIFCLATAGREKKDHAFTVEALSEHIATQLVGLDRLENHGYAFPGRRVRVLATPERAALADRIAAAVRGVEVGRGLLEHAYYDGLRFQIDVRTPGGDDIPLVDGGTFDWVGKLAANHRLVFVASGMGAQLAAHLFRR